MKLHEKVDLTIDEVWGTYKKYDCEYNDYVLWNMKESLKKLANAYSQRDSREPSRYAMRYWYEISKKLSFEKAMECLDYGVFHCESPIELLFYYCFELINIEINSHLCLLPQNEIETENKKYRVDFTLREMDTNKELKVVIECDGYEYHSSSKQMARDNQRQRDLENAGYTIIRFSGSEIYNDPVKCVYETLKRLNIEVKENE